MSEHTTDTPWAGSDQWTATAIQNLVDPGKTPTPEQIAVVEGPLHPTLVVAGAGSGKTETMSMRVLWLVANQGIAPDRILGLTFTRKAAGELGERLRARLAVLSDAIPQLADAESPTVATYNSFAQRIVKEHGWRLGFTQDVTLIGPAAAVQLLTSIVREKHADDLPDLALSTIVADCHSLSQKIAEHGLSFASTHEQFRIIEDMITSAGAKGNGYYADATKMLEIMERRYQYLEIIQEFAARKACLGVIDFADQLALATRLVTDYPEVVATVRGEFDAILLDEFQDTSVIQMQLFSSIFGSHAGPRLAVTAVGDPNQAIYGWRGASSASLEDFIAAFDTDLNAPTLTDDEQKRKSLSQTLTLSTAWRNDKQILFAANVLAAPLAGVSERVIVKPLQPRPGVGPGSVHCHYLATPQHEADYVADHMRRIVDEWEEACNKARTANTPLPPRPSMAVLAKRRKDFDRFQRALTARGLPTQVFDSGGLLDHPTIRRLVAALRCSTDVGDAQSVLYLIDKLRLGASDLSLLWAWANAHAGARHSSGSPHAPGALLMEAIDSPPAPGWQEDPEGPAFTHAAHERVTVLGQRLRALRSTAAHGIEEYVERAIAIMGLVQDSLADHNLNDGRDALDAFMDIVIDYAHGNEWADIPGFLVWLDIAAEEERGLPAPTADPIEGAVHIMTVHGSKGLEWDAVAVIGMSDGAFPQHRSTSKIRTIVSHPGHCSVLPSDLWPESGWITQAKELPYEMRGDRKVLPAFDAAIYTRLEPGIDDTMSFSKWFKEVFRPNIGRHQEREQRRLAYVAVTRARHTLFLTGNWLDTPKGRAPSIYLLEVLRSLVLRVLEKGPADAPTPELRSQWEHSWMAQIPYDTRLTLHYEWTQLLSQWDDPSACIERAQESLVAEEESQAAVYYPTPPTPHQQRIEAGAHAVRELANALPAHTDIPKVLEELGDDPMIRHSLAIIAEHRRKAEGGTHTIELATLSATSVAAFVDDTHAYALHLRRPLPARPSASASLGTLAHAWVERQLRQLTGELWSEPVEGIELLTPAEKRRFATMQDTFEATPLPGRVTALEELFAITVHGIIIQGRIDAVFTDTQGDIIVDWKSGRYPRRGDVTKLRYFRDQLELYRHAWATRTHADPDTVRAQLFFLESGKTLTLETLNEWLDAQGEHVSLDEQISTALTSEDIE